MEDELKNRHSGTSGLKPVDLQPLNVALHFSFGGHKYKLQHKLVHFQMPEYSAQSAFTS